MLASMVFPIVRKFDQAGLENFLLVLVPKTLLWGGELPDSALR